MKVKIGDKIYDSNKEPIVLVLSDQDKVNIKGMDPSAQKFCSFPDTMPVEDAKKFINFST